MVQSVCTLWVGALSSKRKSFVHCVMGFFDQGSFLCICHERFVFQQESQLGDGVVHPQTTYLIFGSVGLRVPLEMAKVAIGFHFDQARAFATTCTGDGGGNRLEDMQCIVSATRMPGMP